MTVGCLESGPAPEEFDAGKNLAMVGGGMDSNGELDTTGACVNYSVSLCKGTV